MRAPKARAEIFLTWKILFLYIFFLKYFFSSENEWQHCYMNKFLNSVNNVLLTLICCLCKLMPVSSFYTWIYSYTITKYQIYELECIHRTYASACTLCVTITHGGKLLLHIGTVGYITWLLNYICGAKLFHGMTELNVESDIWIPVIRLF